MDKVKMAIIFDQQLQQGGGFQQAINAAQVPLRLNANIVEISFFTTIPGNIQVLRCHGIRAKLIRFDILQKAILYFRRLFSEPYTYKLFASVFPSRLECFLLKEGVDLVYFLSPTSWALDLNKLNYITTIWDSCHRDHPEFPEVRADRQFEHRERIFKLLTLKAVAVISDSELGKANLIRRYGIDADRVGVIPFRPTLNLIESGNVSGQVEASVFEKFGVQCPYIFYPAQFWPHKNHAYILRAIAQLAESSNPVAAVFCGSDKGGLARVVAMAENLGISHLVRFLGFVDSESLRSLYLNSIALVMPSYFGPTNLPPLEAFILGVPVMYSDLPGMREQVGDAAFLLDLSQPQNLASGIVSIRDDCELRELLISRGFAKIESISDQVDLRVLEDIVCKFRSKMLTWKCPA